MEKRIESNGVPPENESSNVIDLAGARRRQKVEPPPTDEEMQEYRRIRPLLLKMLVDWPELKRQHDLITQSCPLAIKLLK